MSIGAGTRLGPYEVVSPLGSGGMGEVYRARDTKLGREVAIKILPAAFRSDPDRLARFDREARSLAALNHPNIGAIYGVEEQSGVTALVLELVEGETLAERLGHGSRLKARGSRLPLTEALTIARQIADALDAAHERGIVHRDLKPANIKITPAGTVKVLDFGLAKAVSHGGAAGLQDGPDLSHSPTMMSRGTETGVILGTAAYMSPEQARGSSVDKRADIWAFGCVLYEMFTDCAAFGGATVTDILARILEREPDWTALPASTPPAITRLLRRCLEKDAKRRLRDIGDARQEVEESLIATSNDVASGPSPASTGREVEFQRLTDFVGMKESPAISPDGKMVAFVALVRGRRQIWIRLLAGGAPLQVTRDDVDHREPRWAPDSSTLIYYTRTTTPGGQGTIWESSALGGPPRRVTSSIGGGDISHDGQKIAVFQPGADCIELLAVTRNGSRKECLARLPQEYLCSSPRWSPDGRSIAFQHQDIAPFDMRLEVVSMDGGERREIAGHEWLRGFTWLRDSSGIVYSSSRGSTLLYPPIFNLRTVGRDGRRDSQLTFGDMSYAEPDLHHSGRLLAGRIKSQSDIWRFPIGGSAEENTRGAVRITRQTGQAQTPSVSPDGTELVYLSDNGGHGNLWVAQTDGMEVRQITFERDPTVILGVPMWSPAADWIVFIIVRSGQTGLWLIRPDGSDMHELVSAAWGACWSRDGRWLYYTKGDDGSSRHEKIPVDGGTPVFVRDEKAGGTVAADERTIYYPVRLTSGLFGRWSGDAEIQGVRVEDGAAHTLARIDGSRVPISPHMLQMFLSPDNQWLATPLVDGATTNLWAVPTAGGPMRQLTDFGDRSILIGRSVSWSAEGDSLYAAVAETETDVVLFDGLIQ